MKSFQALSEFVVRECCDKVVSKTYKKGDQLLTIGERVLNIFIILEGKVRRSRANVVNGDLRNST